MRTYSVLSSMDDYLERFRYLALSGVVGEATFGTDRWINQEFYRSRQWKHLREFVIDRDRGCDLGIEDFPIHRAPRIHHMNPMTVGDIVHGDESILDPEYLITTSLHTHNAIHYGDESQLPKAYSPRRPGDTRLWGHRKD